MASAGPVWRDILDHYGLPTLFALALLWILHYDLGRMADAMQAQNTIDAQMHEMMRDTWLHTVGSPKE